MRERQYVRTIRDDGSEVWTGPLSTTNAEREAIARRDAWPTATITIHAATVARDRVRAYERHCRCNAGQRWYPPTASTL